MRIVTLHEEGHSERKIAVKMACSKTAVHTTINNFELYGNYSDKKKSGRPRKTSCGDDHMMKLTASRSPTSSCTKLDVDPQRDDDASPMSTYRCMLRPT